MHYRCITKPRDIARDVTVTFIVSCKALRLKRKTLELRTIKDLA